MTIEDTTIPESLESLFDSPPQKELSDKGKLFVEEYMLDLNASRAARAAGYKSPVFPKEYAVGIEVNRRLKERLDGLKISGERVLREMARIAFSDTRKLFNDDGTPKDFMKLDPDTRAAILSMDLETQGESKNWKTVTKYRMMDKLKALDQLAKHLQLYPNEKASESNTGNEEIADMSENEKARRIAHMLHRAVQKKERNDDIEDAVVIEQ